MSGWQPWQCRVSIWQRRSGGWCRTADPAQRRDGEDQRVELLVVPQLGEVEADRAGFAEPARLDRLHQPRDAAPDLVLTSPLEGEVGEALRAGWGGRGERIAERSPPTRRRSAGDLPLQGGGQIQQHFQREGR